MNEFKKRIEDLEENSDYFSWYSEDVNKWIDEAKKEFPILILGLISPIFKEKSEYKRGYKKGYTKGFYKAKEIIDEWFVKWFGDDE